MKRISALLVAVSIAIGATLWAQSAQRPQDSVPPGDWHTINRELSANRYSPLTQINPSNVAGLTQAWTFTMTGGAQSVPLVVNGVMYVSSGRRVVALDAD